MKASIIMPTYNNVELIIPCLITLNHQVLEEGDSFEVIVVDDGSNDGTGEAIHELILKYALKYFYIDRSLASSRAAARNLGLTEADGEVIIFLDGDHLVPPHFIQEHLRYHRERDDLVVIGFRNYLTSNDFDVESLKTEFREDLLPEQLPADRLLAIDAFSEKMSNLETVWYFFFTCNASVRRKNMQEAGLFHEGFKGWGLEDCELAYRLYQQGLTFVYAKNALIYHMYHPSEYDENRYQNWLRNLHTFQELHPSVDVQLLQLLKLFFNPEIRLFWFDSYLRFEYAVRAAHGNLPYKGPVSVYTVHSPLDDASLNELIREADERVVFVIDESGDFRTSLSLLCAASRFDLMYYAAPSCPQKEMIFRQIAQYGVWRQVDYGKPIKEEHP
ncbi:glycosyltransferase family 2 protein [Paenibacillus woosongensis]|uniref:Glycosyltransferase n=1 Tax=Paenibacillus woosongensis TaxID=307580 RepID=A0A7X2Z5S3_9BACL|nr:glycosyltransferase [Paenibacillus woosongensis]MUG48107.1 glycosyltransferase [Paenibacillus woosongensis]